VLRAENERLLRQMNCERKARTHADNPPGWVVKRTMLPVLSLLRKKPDVSWLWSCWRRHGRRWGSNKTRDGGMEATCPFTLLRWLLRLKAGGQAGLPACSDWPAEREGEEGDNNRAGGKAHAPALGQLNYTWRPSHTRPPWLA